MPPHREFDHEIHIEMTRHLLIATSTHSLAQNSGSCTSSSMTCLARVHPIVTITRRYPSSLCEEEGWYPATLCRLPELNKITRKDRYPIPLVTNSLTNWAVQRSTPSSTSVLATTMFVSQWAMSGKQPSGRAMAPRIPGHANGTHQCSATFQAFMNHIF